ncbi:MAG: DUF3793 family protein [Atopobiaceae bacterium]
MCGAEAMEAGVHYTELRGCSTAESVLCHDFTVTLVKCAAGVLEGTKPMALFSFAPKLCWSADDRQLRSQMIRRIVSAYREGLAASGIGLAVVKDLSCRTMLLAWRGELLEGILADVGKRHFLEHSGFCTQDAAALVRSARQKLAWYFNGARCSGCAEPSCSCRFPHEMGVLFGYPLEDVEGFCRGRVPTCRGAWRAYGDAETAHRRFDEVHAAEEVCRARFRDGATLAELVA